MSNTRAVWRLLSWFALLTASGAHAQTLQNDQLKVQIGASVELSSLQIVHDAFPTNYVLSASNARGQDTPDHAWVGELLLSYRKDGGAYTPALTRQSSDVRKITQDGSSVVVSYEGSQSAQGIRDFKLVERYALEADALRFSIELTNPGSARIEIGDLGLPLPFNELWTARDAIYEARTVYHSFTGQNSSYITIGRPSGVGPLLLLTPDASTGAGFEYMDSWRS